jgi:hypothetical protein
MNIFNSFLREKNDNYNKAKLGLKNVKRKFDGFVISFPDVTPNEIMFVKDKWETLPKNLANGVKIMALSFKNGLKSLITSYQPNSYIMPHRHINEFEIGVILKGSLIDKFNGKTYNVGDKYKFSPNELHYLLSTKDGCVVHSALTSDYEYLLKPLNKQILSKLELELA